MAAARIAAVFLSAIIPLATTPLSSQTQVTIQVTDTGGAPVRGALVDVAPVCDRIGGETNDQGEFTFNFEPGSWYGAITVAFPGLCTEVRSVEILNQARQIIPIELKPKLCPTECARDCWAEPTVPVKAGNGGTVIQVVDISGGVIPGARIAIDPSLSAPVSELITNSIGRVSLNLTTGIHTIAVTSKGFYPWTHQIAVQNISPGMLFALLQVHPTCNPVSISSDDFGYLIQSPYSVFLSPQPTPNLTPLPSHRTRKHWW